MFCRNCGKENDDSFKFCQYCGEKLAHPADNPPEPKAADLPKSVLSTPDSLDAWLIDDDSSLDFLNDVKLNDIPNGDEILGVSEAPGIDTEHTEDPNNITSRGYLDSGEINKKSGTITGRTYDDEDDGDGEYDDEDDDEDDDDEEYDDEEYDDEDDGDEDDGDEDDDEDETEDILSPGLTGMRRGRAAGLRICHQCGANIEAGHRFCGTCGARCDDEPSIEMPNGVCTAARPSFIMKHSVAEQGSYAAFILNHIHDDGSVGDAIDLFEGENIIGRVTSPMLSKDRFINPKHMRITCRGDLAVIEDFNSLNGVFIRISNTSVTLESGDIFRIGEELMSYHHGASNQPLLTSNGDDTTKLIGGTEAEGWGYIRIILGAYSEGNVYRLRKPGVTLGRTRADILFPRDGFVSGTHASIQDNGNNALLTDLESSNGTFIRIKSPVHVTGTSYILIGNKLLRLTRRQ